MGLLIRPLEGRDRAAVRDVLIGCGGFTAEEIQVALDMADRGLAAGPEVGYPLFAAELDGVVRGYCCIGKTPLTHATWYLYWICVDEPYQRRGIGRALQAEAEAFIRARAGRQLVVETSSRREYDRSRKFYLRAGYRQVGRIPDFFQPSDDCIILCNTLTAKP
jgi:ribosomal protein S18 acetylase RimI-like enzyme